ncbi:hypothetical protein GCM10010393_52360 [Streptomyces gobitricini]|uniref:SCO1431 family membrane protein n=1 Tax=Streptomyces gobitricini TaxID=68211 RepID=A0ABN3N2L4_9ACTN
MRAAAGTVMNVSTPEAVRAGTVGDTPRRSKEREPMTTNAAAVAAPRVRTGGPKDDGPQLLEYALGWVLVIVFAMLVTQVGLL